MRKKKYKFNRKIKRMFRFPGQTEATQLAQNFVRYMTDPFRTRNNSTEFIDQENEIYMTEIDDEEGNIQHLAISTQLDYHSDSEIVQKLVHPYLEHHQEFHWYTIGENIDPQEEQFFKELGFIKNEILIGMVKNITNWKKPRRGKKEPKDLKFRRVNDNKRLKDFALTFKSAMGPQSWDYAFYKSLLKINKDNQICLIDLLYKGKEPAVTGMIYFERDIAIIDDIATQRKFRNQGLAKKMINHLLQHAHNYDYNLVGLLSTNQGYNLYHKLGFRPIRLYLNEYVTKSSKPHFDQVIKILSHGRTNDLPVWNEEELLKLLTTKICDYCHNPITSENYLMLFTIKGSNNIILSHTQCYTLQSHDQWIIKLIVDKKSPH